MPKRSKRLLLSSRKQKPNKNHESGKEYIKNESPRSQKAEVTENDMVVARGRLKGVLLEVMETAADDSDSSTESNRPKPDRRTSQETHRRDSTDDATQHRASPVRQSFVLKLFDRSVDLSQFSEDSPLYPICRAWMANQPKANYKKMNITKEHEKNNSTVILPGPDGPPVSKIPALLPEQLVRNKDNINLNYRECPPPSRQQLAAGHAARWARVRRAWADQAARVERRYAPAQLVLNQIQVNI